MMYVSQIIMLYTLNLYSVLCQLYLNKAVSKKSNPSPPKKLHSGWRPHFFFKSVFFGQFYNTFSLLTTLKPLV